MIKKTKAEIGYLLDTTVLVDVMRGRLAGKEVVRKFSEIAISGVSAGELLQGARDKQELRRITKLIGAMNLIEISERISRKSRDLLVKHSLSGGLHLLDALIAATALENGLALVTDNIKHFRFIEGIKVVRSAEMGA